MINIVKTQSLSKALNSLGPYMKQRYIYPSTYFVKKFLLGRIVPNYSMCFGEYITTQKIKLKDHFMAFKLSVTQEDVAKPAGNGSFIGTSGVYPVTIQAVTMDENEHGAVTFGLYVDLGNDNKQMLYGALPMALYDNSKPLEGNQRTFGGLCTLAGVDLDTDFVSVEASLPIGKGGAAKDVAVLEEFEDLEVILWIKQDYYRKKDGSIGENRTVKGVFRTEDNASPDEIINESEVGVRYEKQSKYFTDVGYRDVTEEEVKEMIEARKSGGEAPAKKAATPKRSKFAK
jgi:hypothetical protein